MSDNERIGTQSTVEPPRRPFDDIRNLYVGHIDRAEGTVLMEDVGPVEMHFRGEVLLYGYRKGDDFVVERLRRLILSRIQEKPDPDDPISTLSLVGPLEQAALEAGPIGSVGGLRMRLYYRALLTLEPRCRLADAVFPQLEQMAIRLNWRQVTKPVESEVRLEVEVIDSELLDRRLGTVRSVTLSPTALSFRRVGTIQPHTAWHESLPPNCPELEDELDASDEPAVLRVLPIEFINLTTTPLSDVEGICQVQLLNGVCPVWRNKAALELNVLGPGMHDGSDTDKTNLSVWTGVEINALNNCVVPPSSSALQVYVVDSIAIEDAWGYSTDAGGGITYACGVEDAYCILQLSSAQSNDLLLAHELGHALGLGHPRGTDVPFPAGTCSDLPYSSWESVMVPSGATGGMNPDKNTLYNCRIFVTPPPTGADSLSCIRDDGWGEYNSLAADSGASDYYRPDRVDHFVRDHVDDHGQEPSGPPGTDLWSNSDVWNRRSPDSGLTPGDPDAPPEHEEPHCTGINRMYVRLRYIPGLLAPDGPYPRDPVCVHLYLADPGVSPGFEQLIPLKEDDHYLYFDEMPDSPEEPQHKYLDWTWETVPADYPKSCCVFAIAHSVDEDLPFEDPEAVTFRDVFRLLGADNDIAQRNLHIQNCPPTGGGAGASPLPSWLPWVQMANPFEEAAAARMEIDTTLAPNLEGLSLEINDGHEEEVEVGQSVPMVLAEALSPDERLVLRLKATPPPDVPHETEFPIDLRFFVGGELITGYRHVLRVTPLPRVVVQVMDSLYGALRNVAVAFESDTAQELAQDVGKIVFKAREMESPWNWLTDWGDLTGSFSELAQELKMIPDKESESGVVRGHLQALAELPASTNSISPNLLIEQIRHRADRIQEPAGRLARSRQRAT